MRLALIAAILMLCHAAAMAQHSVAVVDSVTGEPLGRAAVFDRRGNMAAMTADNGAIPPLDAALYPLTVRCMGYKEGRVGLNTRGKLALALSSFDLPTLVVESSKRPVLHIVAYLREYSTLSSVTDTVFLFREKTVDFMVQPEPSSRNPQWLSPRVLSSRSYYRFTNQWGLDSVSGTFGRHFSWSDWINITPKMRMPLPLAMTSEATDTVWGKYSPAEMWRRNGENLNIDINVLADTCARRWAHRLYGNSADNLEFTQFNLRYWFGDVYSDRFLPDNLQGMSFNIESEGRGRGLYKFFKNGENGYVTSYGELYVVDKTYLTLGEARDWYKHAPPSSEIGMLVAPDAPPLDESTLALVARVEGIDHEAIRLEEAPDHRVASFKGKKYGPISYGLYLAKKFSRRYRGK